MRTRDEALHRKRRATILQAAAACFVKSGFHQTSMQDICAAAGMSPGALYRFYPSKKAIIAGMVEQERAENSALLERIGKARTLHDALDEAIDVLVPLFSDKANAQLTLEVAAEGARNPDIARLIAQADQEARGALESALLRAQEKGELRSNVDVRTSTYMLMGLIDGLIGRSALGADISARNLKTALRDLLGTWLEV